MTDPNDVAMTVFGPRVKRPDPPRSSSPRADEAEDDARFGTVEELTRAALIEDERRDRR